VQGGLYQVTLKIGSDGNTIIDECGMTTPAGQSATKMVSDMVSAEFDINISPSCIENVVAFFHDGANGVNNWQWNLASNFSGNIPDPVINYSSAGTKDLSLTVSNGTCSHTVTRTIVLPELLTADFIIPEFACQDEATIIVNNSLGDADFWKWDFGNGNVSNIRIPPPQIYLAGARELVYKITLIVGNSVLNCSDTISKMIRVPVSCRIAVPSGFTPNNDGKNDYLFPLNAYKALDLDFKVFDRFGKIVFATKDWRQQWDGTIRGIPQATGVYAWFLRYTHSETGQKVFIKGTTLLLR
jgi:gliding motility-associated-like protein